MSRSSASASVRTCSRARASASSDATLEGARRRREERGQLRVEVAHQLRIERQARRPRWGAGSASWTSADRTRARTTTTRSSRSFMARAVDAASLSASSASSAPYDAASGSSGDPARAADAPVRGPSSTRSRGVAYRCPMSCDHEERQVHAESRKVPPPAHRAHASIGESDPDDREEQTAERPDDRVAGIPTAHEAV